MKKVLVVAALLGATLIVNGLKQSDAAGAASLAGMGFVMLAAYAVAELGAALALPLVTGYILAGVALGPSVTGIISGQLVGDMRMFNTLALGLIATSAGLELDVRQMARLARTLVMTTLIKVVVGVSLVALAFVLVEMGLGLLGLQGRGEIATVALVLGVLSIGTSPSIALAVLNETRAKGRLSDLVLGAAVFKDLVVVVCLAVAIAVGRVWLAPGAALDAGVLLDVAAELVGSIGAGGLLGVIFILYVRFIGAEMLLFVAAMILVVAEMCRTLHLELLLVFIASGFVVRNFSKFEHQMMKPLRLVALPVFVLFFANAGASVDLATTLQILPLAVALCAARAGAFLLASHLGGKWAGESRSIQRYAWLAYLPQAGVTLGLVGLASLQLPELAGPITNTGMAVVALNLLVGPITLRRALGVMGEIPPSDLEPLATGGAQPGSLPAPRSSASDSSPSAQPLPEPLRQASAELEERLRLALRRFEREVKPCLPALPELANQVPDVDAFRDAVVAHRTKYLELYSQLLEHLAALPSIVLVRVLPAARQSRWRRRGRKVPLRRVARIALGPSLAQLVARRFEEGLRIRPALLDGNLAAPSGGEALSITPPELEHGLERLAELMRDAGTRRLPLRRLRYSDVEPQVRRALQSLSATPEADLARLARAGWGTARLDLERANVTTSATDAIRRNLIDPALATVDRVQSAVGALGEWLGQQRIGRGAALDQANELMRLRRDFEELTRSSLGDACREFRFAATVRTTLGELTTSVESVPESIDCLAVDGDNSQSQGKVLSVPLRAHVDALVRHLMPPIDLAARTAASAMNQLPRRVEDAMQQEWSQIEAQIEGGETSDRLDAVLQRFAPARATVDGVSTATLAAVRAAIFSLEASLDSVYASFGQDVLPGPARHSHREARWQQLTRRVRRARDSVAQLLHRVSVGSSAKVDAATLRQWLRASDRDTLPEAARQCFTTSPVTDDRIFAAHRRLLEGILDAESTRAEAGRVSVLITGSNGAGKSSLLNLCELELPHAMHLRLHASDFGHDVTLFEAMGTLLDCAPTLAKLHRHLELRAPALFVDDLPGWISASNDRQRELATVLELVAQTSHRALWLVSIDASMIQMFGEIARLDEVFTHTLRLPEFSLPEIRRLVESRLELMNMEVRFPSTRWAALFDRVSSASEGERFYRRLWRAARGNPGRAIALCREAIEVSGQVLLLSPARIRAPGLPMPEFTPTQLAALATLHRYGPQPADYLARELGLAPNEVSRSLEFLMVAGLVEPAESGHAFAIARAAGWATYRTLVQARLAVE